MMSGLLVKCYWIMYVCTIMIVWKIALGLVEPAKVNSRLLLFVKNALVIYVKTAFKLIEIWSCLMVITWVQSVFSFYMILCFLLSYLYFVILIWAYFKVYTYDELSSKSFELPREPVTCLKHIQIPCTILCATCEVLICQYCQLDHSDGHSLVNVDERVGKLVKNELMKAANSAALKVSILLTSSLKLYIVSRWQACWESNF